MISFFRRFAKSWVAALLMGLLIISFAVFGMNDVLLGMNRDVVITAGDRQVGSAAFRREFDNYRKNAEQRIGEPVSTEMAVERGLDRQVLEGLASRESLAALIHKVGVRISDAQVAAEIRKIPAFFDQISGRFDQALYAGKLAEQQFTPEIFENLIRDELAQGHVTAAMAAGLQAPRAYAALGAAYALEERDMAWFAITPNSVGQPAPPTDADLTAFMQENAEQLRRPEFRQLTVVRFSADEQAPAVAIDSAEVQKRYEFRRESLSRPETRTVVQVPAKNAQAAAQIAQRLRAGEDPAAVARSVGVEPIVYTDKPKSAIVDRRVADAAFALPAGQVSNAIAGELGTSVVKVVSVTPGASPTLEQVRPEIEQELREELAAEKVYEQTQAYEDAHAGGANLAEAAQKAGVQTLTVGPITAQGQNMQGQPSGVPEAILKAAFELPQGGESDVTEAARGEYFAVRVEKIVPPALPPLAEVKDELARVYTLRKVAERMKARADSLAERVRKGESIQAVAASAGASVQTVDGVSRATAQMHQALGRDLLVGLFGAKEGDVFTGQTPQFGYAIARVTDISAAPTQAVAQGVQPQRRELSAQLFQDIGDAAQRHARATMKTRTYLDRARAAIGVDPTTLPGAKTEAAK